MSDIKRVNLTTISECKSKPPIETSSSNGNNPAVASSSAMNASSSSSATSRTIRLELKLFEPNSKDFPEFNYPKLMHAEKKKHKKVTKSNGILDVFAEDDDDNCRRIAKDFEKKYGNEYGSKKYSGRTNVAEADKGAGYDESDSFIDNTEAYDELIPDEVESEYGGFYINSGKLEFKNISNFERPEDALKMPKARKRIHSSSSSDSSECEDEQSTTKDINKKRSEHLEKKVKSHNELNNKVKDDNKESKTECKLNDKEDVTSNVQKDDVVKVVKATSVKDMLRVKRDKLRNMQQNGEVDVLCNDDDDDDEDDDSDKDSSSSSSSSDSSDESEMDTNQNAGDQNKPPTVVVNGAQNPAKSTHDALEIKLPDNLPGDMLQCILKVKDAAKLNRSKNAFFTPTVMHHLNRIDEMARQRHICGQVYSHLEQHLPCSKQTLSKKIRLYQEDLKVSNAFNNLKKTVDEIMPTIQAAYAMECQQTAVLEAANATNKSNGEPHRIKYPRKRFPWNETLRTLLCDLITVKRSSFDVIKPRKDTAEDFITNYLKNEVLPIWTNNWMKIEDLQRILEKRKNSEAKKPKENKKPSDGVGGPVAKQQKTAINLSVHEPSTNNNNNSASDSKSSIKQSSSAKSVLATNNAVMDTSGGIVDALKTDDRIVGSVAPNCGIPYASGLVITAVDSRDTPNSAKPLPTVQNKVTITNLDLSKSSGQSKNASGAMPNTSKHNESQRSIDNLGKSGSTTGSNTSSAATSKDITHNTHGSSSINLKSSLINPYAISKPKTILPTDYSSPTKKSTDHSINSIISSPPPTVSLLSPPTSPITSTASTIKHSVAATGAATAAYASSTDTAISSNANISSNHNKTVTSDTLSSNIKMSPSSTHIINLDSPTKTKSDIMIAAVHSHMDIPHLANSSPNSSSNIWIRNVSSMSNSSPAIETKAIQHATNNKQKKEPVVSLSKDALQDDDTDSDGVEYVGEFQNIAGDMERNVLTNRQVEKKSSFTGTSKSKPINQNKYVKDASSSNSKSSLVPKVSIPQPMTRKPNIDNSDPKEELDVIQIMKALKELQSPPRNSTTHRPLKVKDKT